MNLHHIKTFYFVAKNKSMKLAAEEMGIAQSAIARHIIELQRNYKIELFEKSDKKMCLTDIGEDLFTYAKTIFNTETDISNTIEDYNNYKSGKITIAASDTFGAYYLPQIIYKFSNKYPEIKITVIASFEKKIKKMIEFKKADIGFLSTLVESKSLSYEKILSDPLLLCYSLTNTKINNNIIFDLSMLQNFSFIMLEKTSSTHSFVKAIFKKIKINPEVKYTFSHNEAVKDAVQNNLGISILSGKVLEKEIKAKSLKASYISDQKGSIITKDFFVVKHTNKYNSRMINEFIAYAKEWASEYAINTELKL